LCSILTARAVSVKVVRQSSVVSFSRQESRLAERVHFVLTTDASFCADE
jgi:hypothetical protein